MSRPLVTGYSAPPLRLLLGADAVGLAEKASRARAAEAEKWAAVSSSTDFAAGA
jgi:hypothetical protein